MAVEVALGTPLAEALSNVVQPKLVEVGWSGEDDTSLAEYIILMLVNGKTQEQIASELAQDLLPDGEGTVEFAQWLFDQVTRLKDGPGGQQPPQPPATQALVPPNESAPQGDANMSEASNVPTDSTVPTGPKAMRGGKQSGRGGRMVNNMNKTMDRSGDSVLHRTRGAGINSHPRQAPRGHRNDQNRTMRHQQLGAAMGLNGPGMQQNGAQSGMMMSPQQQMQLMAMMEEQARMMAQFMPGMMTPGMGGFQNGQQTGRPLSDRIEAPGRGRGGRGGRGARKPFQNGQSHMKQDGEDTTMGDASVNKTGGDPSSSMEVESSQQNADSSKTLCRFNIKCTRRDCPFAHQSPSAPEGITVDMSDTCSYGAACKNYKCTAKHPSPAQRASHQAEEQCKFWPNCANPSCSFKHPSMPMCRNGGDCTVPHCKFTHVQTPCKFNPCLNPKCPFKHGEGQRGGNVWKADNTDPNENDHVSERKFVDEAAGEELIKPDNAEGQEGVVT